MAETGVNFTLEHCWVILRDTKKFQDTSENSLVPLPSSPTSSRHTKNMASTSSNQNRMRPSGCKTAKKEAAASKSQDNLDIAVIKSSEKLADAVVEKGMAIRDFSEARIMGEDPDKMTGARRKWHLMKQEEIMARYKNIKPSSKGNNDIKSE